MTTDTGQVEGGKEGYRVVREIGRRRNFDPHFPIVRRISVFMHGDYSSRGCAIRAQKPHPGDGSHRRKKNRPHQSKLHKRTTAWPRRPIQGGNATKTARIRAVACSKSTKKLPQKSTTLTTNKKANTQDEPLPWNLDLLKRPKLVLCLQDLRTPLSSSHRWRRRRSLRPACGSRSSTAVMGRTRAWARKRRRNYQRRRRTGEGTILLSCCGGAGCVAAAATAAAGDAADGGIATTNGTTDSGRKRNQRRNHGSSRGASSRGASSLDCRG